MKIPVYNQAGQQTDELVVPEIFDSIKRNDDLVHQALRTHLINTHHPWAHTKDRSEVRGGGKKPWAQKGTGRARHGSTRSPIWRSGGVTFGPRNDQGSKIQITTQMRRKAILTVIAQKLRQQQVKVIEPLAPTPLKTKMAEKMLSSFLAPRQRTKRETALLAFSGKSSEAIRSIRNLPYADALEARNLNVHELLSHKYLLTDKQGLEIMAAIFGKKKTKKD